MATKLQINYHSQNGIDLRNSPKLQNSLHRFLKSISNTFLKLSNADLKRDNERRRVGLYYFQNFFSDFPKPWFFQSDLKKRRDIVNISRLRSNHYAFAGNLAR